MAFLISDEVNNRANMRELTELAGGVRTVKPQIGVGFMPKENVQIRNRKTIIHTNYVKLISKKRLTIRKTLITNSRFRSNNFFIIPYPQHILVQKVPCNL